MSDINCPILITSFQTWQKHQASNASDDLIAALQAENRLPDNAVLLRHLPVSFELAHKQVEEEIMRSRPSIVICCGMAESRSVLSIEKQATHYPLKPTAHLEKMKDDCKPVLQTNIDVHSLIADTLLSEVSEDAGSYVCNHLYYQTLALSRKLAWEIVVLFVHVPVLNSRNTHALIEDFSAIIERLSVRISQPS